MKYKRILPQLYIPWAPGKHKDQNAFAQARFAIQSAAAKGRTTELLERIEKYPRRATDALYWASGNGHKETVTALLARYVKPTVRAIIAAKSNDHQEIVQILRQHSARNAIWAAMVKSADIEI